MEAPFKKGEIMAQIESGLVHKRSNTAHKLSKIEAQKKLDESREKDHTMVTGVFRYLEHPGQALRFRFQKYHEDGFPEYELWDGRTYNLPRMIARHLNTEVAYKQYSHLTKDGMHMASGHHTPGRYVGNEATDGLAKNQQAQMFAIKRLPRCEFRPLMFTEDDLDIQPKPDIVQVASVI